MEFKSAMSTTRRLIIKLSKVKGKKKILKTAEAKKQTPHTDVSEAWQARTEGHEIVTVPNGENTSKNTEPSKEKDSARQTKASRIYSPQPYSMRNVKGSSSKLKCW